MKHQSSLELEAMEDACEWDEERGGMSVCTFHLIPTVSVTRYFPI